MKRLVVTRNIHLFIVCSDLGIFFTSFCKTDYKKIKAVLNDFDATVEEIAGAVIPR